MFQLIKACLLLVLCSLSLTHGLRIISRQEWKAREPKNVTPIRSNYLPVPFVVIHHSAVHTGCKGEECVKAVRGYQNYHMDQQKWDDIGYNFLVSPEGEVFEGAGWGIMATHSPPYNRRSVGICIIGNYMDAVPTQQSLKAVQDLIKEGVQTNEIKQNYRLIGHRQGVATLCPGDKLFDIIKTWPNWVDVD